MTIPKKLRPWLIAGAAVIVALIFTARACSIGGKYAVLEAQYQDALKISKANAEIQAAVIKAQETKIADQDKKLAASEKAVAGLQGHIGTQDAGIAVLEGQLANAKTDSERVPILTAQVKAWAEKFTLAEKIIAEKDDQLRAWEVKFDAQVVISESWKSRWEDEARLHDISRQEISALRGQLRSSRLMGTLKTGLVILAGGYLGYQALVKK